MRSRHRLRAGSMRDEFLVRARPKSRRSTTTSVRAVRAADAMIAYARRCGGDEASEQCAAAGTEELPTVFADFRCAPPCRRVGRRFSVMPHAMGRGIFAAELYGTE